VGRRRTLGLNVWSGMVWDAACWIVCVKVLTAVSRTSVFEVGAGGCCSRSSSKDL